MHWLLPLLVCHPFHPMRQQAATLSYRTNAKRAKLVLAEISQVAGMKLEASGATADEILAIRLDKAPVEEAMKRIAWAVSGEWTPHNGGLMLTRQPSLEHAEERREAALTGRAIAESIARRVKLITDNPNFTSVEADRLAASAAGYAKSQEAEQGDQFAPGRVRIEGSAPIGRALTRLVATLDPADLVSLSVGIKVAYAVDPTPAQRQLAPAASTVLDQFMDEQEEWRAAAMRHQLPVSDSGQRSSGQDLALGISNINHASLGKVLLTAFRFSSMFPIVQLELLVSDRQKRVVATQTTMIGADLSQISEQMAAPAPKDAKSYDTPGEAVAAQSLLWRQAGEPAAAIEQARQKFLQPEKTEPLSLATGRMFLACADVTNRQLVVDLPDSAIRTFWQPAPKFVPDQFLKMSLFPFFERDTSSDWLLYRPALASYQRSVRVDREALGQFLRRYAEDRLPSLDDQATMAITLPRELENPMPSTMREAVSHHIEPRIDENLLRFYGHLDPEAKDAARRGLLKFGRIPTAGLDDIEHIICGEQPALEFRRTPEFAGVAYPLMIQPTECMPNGIPPDGTLHFVVDARPVVQLGNPLTGRGLGLPEALEPPMFGFVMYSTTRPDLFPNMAQKNNVSLTKNLRFGSKLSINMQFRFKEDISMDRTLQSLDVPSDRRYSFEDLPEDFRKQVQMAIDQNKKAYANAKPGDPIVLGAPVRLPPPP